MMSVPSIDALTAGNFFSAMHRRLDEEAHEAELDAVLLLEPVFVPVAQIDHRLHVDFVERRQDRGGRLRLHETLGHALAQPGHRHTLFRTARRGTCTARSPAAPGCRAVGARNRRRCGRCGWRPDAAVAGAGRGRCRFRRRDHVAFRDPAAAAGAVDVGRIHGEVRHHLARRGQRGRRNRRPWATALRPATQSEPAMPCRRRRNHGGRCRSRGRCRCAAMSRRPATQPR
jgi:hypothetical protein